MGRKKKEEKKSYLYTNIGSMLLIFFGVIIVIAYFQPQETLLKNYLISYFGFSSILLGIFMALVGSYLSPLVNFKFLSKKLLIGCFVLFLSILIFDGLINKQSVFGSLMREVLGQFVGFYGSLIVGIMLFFLSVYLMFTSRVMHLMKHAKNVNTSSFTFPGIPSFNKLAQKEENEPDESSIEKELNFNFDSLENMESPVEAVPEKIKREFEEVDTLSEPLELVKSKNAGYKEPVFSHPSHSEVPNSIPEKPSGFFKNKIWEYPPLTLLTDAPKEVVDFSDIEERKRIIIKTLNSFSIKASVVGFNRGPSVTQYEIKVDEGTKTSRILSLQNDLALALASPNGQVRIEAPIPGKSHIGIEVPNTVQSPVYFKPLLTSPAYKMAKDRSKLAIVIGKDVGGNYIYYPLNKMPHLLVAGATGSGKSVMIHSIIFSILYANSPDECKFIMIDPKRVEMVHYNGIPHLLTPVINDAPQAVSALRWVVEEMDKRLQTLSKSGTRNIEAYNEKSGFQAMPYIVVIIDELADLMMTSGNEVERYIARIGAVARATGIHLVLATQRPSTDIITGLIKANIPTRISFNVSSQVDSRVILDTNGAEKLLGRGDMLFVSPESSKPFRVQGAYVKDDEIYKLVNYLKSTEVQPDYNPDIVKTETKEGGLSVGGKAANGKWSDELFPEAVKIVVEYGRGSSSLLQRRLSIGYARAARLIDELQNAGVLGEIDPGTKSREVLINSSEEILGE